MEKHLQELVEEVEEEQRFKTAHKFRSSLNQPSLISVNSTDAEITTSQDGYTEFSVNLPRPILDVDTIQLVNANIPQCSPSIPNTACGFWYYRLNAYSGIIPSPNNLHWVRLLPSYYHPEMIPNNSVYGYNITFPDYNSVSTQLGYACRKDLANDEYQTDDTGSQSFYESKFLPYDSTIVYNSQVNKFIMTGQNVYNPPAFEAWDVATAYVVGNKVFYTDLTGNYNASYTCIVANTGNQPDTSPTYWVQDNSEIVEDWSSTLTYGQNRIVAYNGALYISQQDSNTNHTPDSSPAWWSDTADEENFVWNTYLITGYNDPNVRRLQGRCYKPYDDVTLFEENDIVDYQGAFYKAVRQTYGAGIPSADWELYSTPIQTISATGDVVTIKCDTTIFAGLTGGETIYIVDCANDEFNLYPATSYTFYANEYTFVSAVGGVLTLDAVYFDAGDELVLGNGGRVCLGVAKDIGLQGLSGQYDYTMRGVFNIPPQPFVPNPKRLLNSILGFTWNGIFSPVNFNIYYQNTPTEITEGNTTLYNRLRPVPQYLVALANELGVTLGDPDIQTTIGIYVADGYCNLVYTNVMSIYASAVGGSTLDTKRNTGLLALGTMDCGNLGVSFFNPVVNNPLSIKGDINFINFEFEDECGDPYYFTNNAVITIALKITYAKDTGKSSI